MAPQGVLRQQPPCAPGAPPGARADSHRFQPVVGTAPAPSGRPFRGMIGRPARDAALRRPADDPRSGAAGERRRRLSPPLEVANCLRGGKLSRPSGGKSPATAESLCPPGGDLPQLPAAFPLGGGTFPRAQADFRTDRGNLPRARASFRACRGELPRDAALVSTRRGGDPICNRSRTPRVGPSAYT